MIITQEYLESLADEEENYFPQLSEKLSEEFPQGMMFDYCGIEFYVKNFSDNSSFFSCFAEFEQTKLWVVCEYFDKTENEFKEKFFTEDFIRTRMKVLKEIVGR